MKIIAFTVADENNQKHADKLIKSFHKFHPNIEFKVYGAQEIGNKENYLRQKPLFAKDLIKDYDLVLGFDADQIVTGKLDYLFEEEYDVGTVLNYNKTDNENYGTVSVFDIPKEAYVNCGLVAMRSERFINHWWNLCNTYHFEALRYREQDLLNVLIHYGDYVVECFDFPNQVKKYNAWHGLVAKDHYLAMKVSGGRLVLPQNGVEKEIKVLHSAGGGSEPKIGDSYRTLFNEDVISYIDGLIK